jgi:hypothetical protein
MARGWESKSVEEQQAEAASRSGTARPRPTPAQAARQQWEEGLLLSRKHILQQLQVVQNPHHRRMLEAALTDLEAQLARPG